MDGDPVQFGTFPTGLPPAGLRDRCDSNLPTVDRAELPAGRLGVGYPTYDNADTFVTRLARRGLVVHDDTIDRAVHGLTDSNSVRSIERHFQKKATGLSYRTAWQIERARHATNLLRDGWSILDTVHQAGYLTRRT